MNQPPNIQSISSFMKNKPHKQKVNQQPIGNLKSYTCHWYCMKCGRKWETVKPRSLGSPLPTIVEAISLHICHHPQC